MKTIKEMSNEELVRFTISALNGDDYEEAAIAKEEALRRGDAELTKQIEYLWSVL